MEQLLHPNLLKQTVFHYRRKSDCSKIYLKGGKTFLLKDGIAIWQDSPAINLYASVNGTGTIATSGNISAQNVRIGSLHHWLMNMFITILQVRMSSGVMSLGYILFSKTIPAVSSVLILMTRIVNTAIKMMCSHSWMYARDGMFLVTSNVHVQATGHMFGYSLMLR